MYVKSDIKVCLYLLFIGFLQSVITLTKANHCVIQKVNLLRQFNVNYRLTSSRVMLNL